MPRAIQQGSGGISFRVSFHELVAFITEIGHKAPGVTSRKMREWFKTCLLAFRRQRLCGRPGLILRSGKLYKSFKYTLHGTSLSDIRGSFYTESKYAPMHEFGATIRPKYAKALAIPVKGPALTSRGISRYSSPLRINLPLTHQFYVRWNAGESSGVLMGRKMHDKGSAARFVTRRDSVWYTLQKSATIPKRLYFRYTIYALFRDLFAELEKAWHQIAAYKK